MYGSVLSCVSFWNEKCCNVLCHSYVQCTSGDPARIYRILPQIRPDLDPSRIQQFHRKSGRIWIRCTPSYCILWLVQQVGADAKLPKTEVWDNDLGIGLGLGIWLRFGSCLPNDVMMADNINLFKNHLDKFWSSCEFVYSYRAQPFGTASV